MPYRTPNSAAYDITVNKGDSACGQREVSTPGVSMGDCSLVPYLDCVDGTDRYPRYSHAGKDMSSDLKETHHECSLEHASRWFADTPSLHCPETDMPNLIRVKRSVRSCFTLFPDGKKEHAIPSDKGELDKGQSDGVSKPSHD